MERTTQTKRDIKNILVVLTAAILCAGLLSLVFIYYYGPSGRYVAGNVILDPSVIEQINAQDTHSKKGGDLRFSFDRIEFSYYVPKHSQPQIQSVSPANYAKFYSLVSSEKSLEEIPPNIEPLFTQSRPITLSIFMRTIEPSKVKSEPQVFQMIQFIPEDYFRVQLRDGKDQGEWAYFNHPQLYLEVMGLFTAGDH